MLNNAKVKAKLLVSDMLGFSSLRWKRAVIWVTHPGLLPGMQPNIKKMRNACGKMTDSSDTGRTLSIARWTEVSNMKFEVQWLGIAIRYTFILNCLKVKCWTGKTAVEDEIIFQCKLGDIWHFLIQAVGWHHWSYIGILGHNWLFFLVELNYYVDNNMSSESLSTLGERFLQRFIFTKLD